MDGSSIQNHPLKRPFVIAIKTAPIFRGWNNSTVEFVQTRGIDRLSSRHPKMSNFRLNKIGVCRLNVFLYRVGIEWCGCQEVEAPVDRGGIRHRPCLPGKKNRCLLIQIGARMDGALRMETNEQIATTTTAVVESRS